ncbi:MAG: ArsR/SmtB family transcription factor [Spirochaetota bacterium]
MDSRKYTKIFKALSNENRLELYLEIVKVHEASFETGCECCISDIKKCFNIGAPTISHHLKELESAELIRTKKKGKFLVCTVNEKTANDAIRLLSINRKHRKDHAE